MVQYEVRYAKSVGLWCMCSEAGAVQVVRCSASGAVRLQVKTKCLHMT